MKVVKKSMSYLVLGFLPMGVNFFLSPLYSRILSPDQNALIGQAAVLQSFFIIFINLSIDSAFTRFYFDYYKEPEKLKQYMSTIIVFTFITAIILALIMHFFGNPLFSFIQKNTTFTYSKYGVWIFITSFSIIIQTIFLAYFRNSENVKGFAIVSLSCFFLSLIFTLIGIMYFKLGAYGSIIGRAVGFLLMGSLFLIIFFKKTNFCFKKIYLIESLKFALPLIPYLFLMALYSNIDRIMVEHYFSLTELGIYNFAFLISGAVSVFISSGSNVVSPMINKIWTETPEDTKSISKTFNWYHLICTGILTIGLAASVFFTEYFIAQKYQSLLNYIGPLFLAYIFRIYYIMYVDSLFYFKKTKWIFLITLLSFLIGLLSNLLLIPKLGIFGVAVSVIIINLMQAFGARLQIYLYKINYNFYSLRINHVYSFSIILVYFLSYIILSFYKQNLKYSNYIPLLITVIFMIIFLLKNHKKIMLFISPIVDSIKEKTFFK